MKNLWPASLCRSKPHSRKRSR